MLFVLLLAPLAVLVLMAAALLRWRKRPAAPPEPSAHVRQVVLAAAVAPASTISGPAVPARPNAHASSGPDPVSDTHYDTVKASIRPVPARRAQGHGRTLDELDTLLAELESTTVRIDGADELDERAVAELEALAMKLEAAAAAFVT